MSSSSKHHKKPTSRSSDARPAYPSGSASSSRHAHRDIELRTQSSNSYWDTVIEKPECSHCKRQFPSLRSYEEHKLTCSEAKLYPCPECDTAFKKNSNLVKHRKLVHRGERNFKCQEPDCGRLFGQKSNLSSHIKAVHLGEKPFECEFSGCGKKFSQKSGLKAHVKTVHNRERPYVCNVQNCGSSFGHRGDLNRHIRVIHENKRPFECPICPQRRAFGRKSVLNRHMQTHQLDGDVIMSEASAPR